MVLALGADDGDGEDADRRKAAAFFRRGQSVADAAQFDYAIEMYLQGLNLDPDNVDAHQALREVALRRKAAGGKDLGMFEKMKLKAAIAKGNDRKANMRMAEEMLAYDPGNTEHMSTLLDAAVQAEHYATARWVSNLLKWATDDGGV